jgi:hypothetical protein
MLYNYVRFTTILRKHSDLVTQGQYPELPPIDQARTELIMLSKVSTINTNIEHYIWDIEHYLICWI